MLREHLEENLRSGQIEQVVATAVAYFQQPPTPTPEALWVAVYACRATAAKKQWGKVIMWAEQGFSLQLVETDPEAEGWLDLFLGTAQMYLGNVYRAEKALQAFQRVAAQTPALQKLIPYGHFNRAILMRFMRRYEDEVRSLEKAAEGFAASGLTRQPLQCRLELAWAHLIYHRPALALPELEIASQLLPSDGDEELRLDAEIIRAFYHSLTGNPPAAERICRTLLADQPLTPRQRADALWILGTTARTRGNIDMARYYADEAYQSAVLDFWPLQIERIQTLHSLDRAN